MVLITPDELEKAFYKVLEDLKDFLPFLVIVGGWVPFIYNRFLWMVDVPRASYTTDIDFGFTKKDFSIPNKTVYERLSKLGYGERHKKIGHLFPISPFLKMKNSNITIPLEFITDKNTPDEVIKNFIGKQILVNKLKFINLLLKDPIQVRIKYKKTNLTVKVPSVSTYLFHKIITFGQRMDAEKKAKDAYYAYYVLRYHPDKASLEKELIELQKHPACKYTLGVLENYFNSKLADGILLVEREFGPDPFIDDLRQDIFERFAWLRAALRE